MCVRVVVSLEKQMRNYSVDKTIDQPTNNAIIATARPNEAAVSQSIALQMQTIFITDELDISCTFAMTLLNQKTRPFLMCCLISTGNKHFDKNSFFRHTPPSVVNPPRTNEKNKTLPRFFQSSRNRRKRSLEKNAKTVPKPDLDFHIHRYQINQGKTQNETHRKTQE